MPVFRACFRRTCIAKSYAGGRTCGRLYDQRDQRFVAIPIAPAVAEPATAFVATQKPGGDLQEGAGAAQAGGLPMARRACRGRLILDPS
jgi:hypothetical protein